jgi:hypothetical protein
MKRATTKKSKESLNIQERVTSNSYNNKKLNAMKTKNNVQKTVLKSMAVVISFVLISITVNAQDFWKSILENTSFNEIALAMVENNTKTITSSSDAHSFAAILEVENEEELELENWMIDETLFDANLMSIETESEAALELEGWMTDDSNFGNSGFEIIEETEHEMLLEDWMLNEDLFNATEEGEQPLELESWMISEEIWIG